MLECAAPMHARMPRLHALVHLTRHALQTGQCRKLIYCSRTVPEIEKALAELQRYIDCVRVCECVRGSCHTYTG